MLRRMKRTFTLFLLLVGSLLAFGCAREQVAPAPTVLLVVRHAEKAAVEGADPPISEAGVERARSLAQVAEAANVSAIYCTQFRRTRETAEPLAARTGAQITTLQVNPDDLRLYVERLAADILENHRGQTIAVVSHSNTVPLIVERFGGKAIPAIRDDEYDNLFIVVVPAEGGARTIKASYGS